MTPPGPVLSGAAEGVSHAGTEEDGRGDRAGRPGGAAYSWRSRPSHPCAFGAGDQALMARRGRLRLGGGPCPAGSGRATFRSSESSSRESARLVVCGKIRGAGKPRTGRLGAA